MNKIQLDI